jgi:hypothetical protein
MMAIKRTYLPPVLLAVAAAASIAAAPSALLDVACASLGDSSTACQTPGNVQISSSPPAQTLPQPEDYYGANGHGPDSDHGPVSRAVTLHHDFHRG